MGANILAIDQGTTSTRSIVFNEAMRVASVSQVEFGQHFPRSGWVEHDATEIWESVVTTVISALEQASLEAGDLAALGITNQRETVVVWDRKTGTPVHHAIVWQDRRTSQKCQDLKDQGLEATFSAKTGLLLDPYFSGTKLAWLLDTVDGLRARAVNGEICFGTVDSWLIYKLTGGQVHATDATNASRTLLYNIIENKWDEELLRILNIPMAMMPVVKDSADEFGMTDPSLFGRAIAITGVAGDQQAATIGNACFEPGMMKSTYGTGCFAMLNTGSELVPSNNRLLSTIAYRLKGETTYALEGSIFIAGAAVQWLRDGMGLIERAEQSGVLADQASAQESVYMVPAFTGLGAPHWNADVRGAIYGITRNTGPAEFAKAALESVAFQTYDLMDAMMSDWTEASGENVLRVDGGMVASDWAMQRLSDILNACVDRPVIMETTALGAAWLAGVGAGVWPDMDSFAKNWALERRFEPSLNEDVRREKLAGWRDAVARTLWSGPEGGRG